MEGRDIEEFGSFHRNRHKMANYKDMMGIFEVELVMVEVQIHLVELAVFQYLAFLFLVDDFHCSLSYHYSLLQLRLAYVRLVGSHSTN